MDVKTILLELRKEIELAKNDLEKTEALQRIKEMTIIYDGEDKLISSLEIAERLRTIPRVPGIKTGFTQLDAILDGFFKKQVIVISAATKSGKTSFCIELTTRLKEQKPVWFPFEEPAEDLIEKFLYRKEEPPLFYTPAKMTGNTIEWIEKKIIEGKARFDSNVFFIDHLHFIVPFSEKRQDIMIGHVMRELKRIAKTWNVFIFLIAHMKKAKVEQQPDLESLRDSSFVAQEADTVIMMWRQTERVNGKIEIGNKVNISIQANRHNGRTGNVPFLFQNGKFLELDKAHEEQHDNNTW